MKLLVSPEGVITAIYSDDLVPLIKEAEKVNISRASHVEPDDKGQWWATMKPFGEEVLLGPFETHKEAITEEVNYLEERLFNDKRAG